MLPYGLILLVLCIGLTCHYVLVTTASARSKVIVGLVVCGSLVLVWLRPTWSFLALALQLAASAYVLLYYKIVKLRP
jgi:hypothetical protein